jgi:superfamily I DNA/RNA helicase
MAVDNEIFFGDKDANRCAFFVGVSRAKRRLILTHAALRDKPQGHAGRWHTHRTEQEEFFSYAAPFVATDTSVG